MDGSKHYFHFALVCKFMHKMVDEEESSVNNERKEDKSSVAFDEPMYDVEEKDPSIHCVTLTYGSVWPDAISWSRDGKICVGTENGIYIFAITNSNKRKKAGVSIGLKVETTLIQNISTVRYDSGVDISDFKDRSKNTFTQRAEFICDQATLCRDDYLWKQDKYSVLRWSPPACTNDGGCCLATVSADGSFHIHKLKPQLGKWVVTLDCTQRFYQYLKECNWLLTDNEESTDNPSNDKVKDKNDIIAHFEKHKFRKYVLFTSTICWAPELLECKTCIINENPENVYYTSYLNNFAKCQHADLFLISASRSGDIFVWLVSFDLQTSVDSFKFLFHWKVEVQKDIFPVSLAWYQESESGVFIAVGLTNGCIYVYHLTIQYEDRNYRFYLKNKIDVWSEEDLLSVTSLCWAYSKASVLCLVAAKGTDVVMFKFGKDEETNSLICCSCEIAPSSHTSPITSLHCINNKFVLSSSDAATQYFDIDNEVLPFCENNILRGFRCFGIDGDKSMCMFARVSCANRFLLHQIAFVKQLEISFLPFLPPTAIAENVLNRTQPLDMCVREYFSISAAEDFLLPDVLHKFCDEPDSYEKTLHELQIYLYFNQLRYMRQTGLRQNSLTREEVKSNSLSESFDDPVIKKLEAKIELIFYREMLTKCLQLHEFGWLNTSSSTDFLTLLLIADWLVNNRESLDDIEISKSCYTALNDHDSLEALAEFQEKLKESHQKVDTEVNTQLNEGCKDDSKSEQISSSNSDETMKTEDIEENLQKNDNVIATNGSSIKIFKELDNKTTASDKIVNSSKTTITQSDVHFAIAREKCPYCQQNVCLPKSLRTTKCSNSHRLNRCSLTLRIINQKDNASCRRCTNCDRVVLRKDFSAVLNVESVMLNIDTCPFCGCTFRNMER